MSFGVPKLMEQHRTQLPGYPMGDKKNGYFEVRHMGLRLICSEGYDWQHVSVSRRGRPPGYEDMKWAKHQFWSADECVMELHVPAADHINDNNNVLHLWRPLKAEIPRPPVIMV